MSEAKVKSTPTMRVADDELQAMARAVELLGPLDTKTRWRVICWLNSRYGYGQTIGEFDEKAEAVP